MFTAGLFNTLKKDTMLKLVKKRFDLRISRIGQSSIKTFELDKNIVIIKGLLLTSDKDDLLYYRGTQKIEINGEEYFPDNYESKLLMSGINVAPMQRYYDLGDAKPGNGVVKVTYLDTEDDRIPFSPYRISVYLNCLLDTTL
jgi:hypothetical protein